ncbi:formyltransferase isoform X3 [Tasmannia lanceolata]|uniref:formyltransferase isoform X3 n=1 Tax=Tasmannia lanceolata TaxID=3420 RepID=UPI0040645F26
MNKAKPSMLLRRLSCCSGASSALDPTRKKKQLVFMGSPQGSVSVLDKLFDASKVPNSTFQVAAIVTQPPAARARGRKLMPCPVAQHALDRGFPSDLIFTPERASEPEVCVTAAYGNILPSKFLEIPHHGTVNIHPSLLPFYRGAAPVQRALQDGVKETGVSLVFTVRALDAGPIIAFERVEVDDHIKAPELLSILFDQGSNLLIRELPSIFDGSAKLKAQVQDDSKATLAPKIKSEESWLSFDQEARVLHNKVRAFAGWPGTRARVQLLDGNRELDILELKIITTRAPHRDAVHGEEDDITLNGGALIFPCAGCSALEVLEIQLPGKKVVSAREFWNGLRGQRLKILQ